ncbi:hypothetical protein A5757_18650 [Mycobacterium sp. 852013-51886_SCH5428379]|uniref:hypothetical protein n=1 Tax=Mycobacterium sp. 852013-51886_SCH5428379 TaxID=1834111 RepID=UPI0007FF95B5|nr:hypothetical protein [Mycobacterium sp. 852013-51886_SCH5428379]OBB58020.1 hypothetical protein A5757_18650 [Mycobacterium sp. 852013-51886_SCH5428379]
MAQLSAWMGAGVLAAGVSAALIAGADTASADTGSDTSSSGVSSKSSRAESSDAKSSDSSERTAGITRGGSEPARTTSGTRSAETRAEAEEAPSAGVERAARAQARTAQRENDGESASATTTLSARQVPLADAAQPATSTARPQPLLDAVQSLVFDVIGVAVTAVAGPPIAAPGTDVTVRSSTLEITTGRTVPADWYYPAGDEVPQRLIYLQHGFLGVGAMYSFTASYLADSTRSVVVVPTLSSNRYRQDGFWLGDDQVYQATANLLLGDRDALTASAVAAGFAEKYGAEAALPEQFMIVGHSLGAGVAAGAAGYYAEAIRASGARNQLAGLVLLDGAPPANVLPDGLDKLELLDTYIPVFELGAPKQARRVDAALVEHRPGYFNGVILDGGQHLDAMQGGTPAIQFISYLYQGFPTEQNKAAAQTIIAGWANDIFAGRINPETGRCDGAACAGVYGLPGEAFELDTSAGPASGVAIGLPVIATPRFQPAAADAVTPPTAARMVRLQG